MNRQPAFVGVNCQHAGHLTRGVTIDMGNFSFRNRGLHHYGVAKILHRMIYGVARQPLNF